MFCEDLKGYMQRSFEEFQITKYLDDHIISNEIKDLTNP